MRPAGAGGIGATFFDSWATSGITSISNIKLTNLTPDIKPAIIPPIKPRHTIKLEQDPQVARERDSRDRDSLPSSGTQVSVPK